MNSITFPFLHNFILNDIVIKRNDYDVVHKIVGGNRFMIE